MTTLLCAAGCDPELGPRPAAVVQAPIVYGDDDRLEVYEAEEPFRGLARQSAVALLGPPALREREDGRYDVIAPPLGESFELCEGERFAEQTAAATCSGVLIGEDLVATAGHCLGIGRGAASAGACAGQRFVFGYELEAEGRPRPIPPEHVFECREIVARSVSELGAACEWDLAIVQLARAVPAGLRPAPIRAERALHGEPLTVIGFPAGLPAKVAGGATVIDAREYRGDLFTLDSDTFIASSGSGVFDAAGELIGIMVGGGADFELDPSANCRRVRKRPAAQGDDVERAQHAFALERALAAAESVRALAPCDSEGCAIEACSGGASMADAGVAGAAARAGCSVTPARGAGTVAWPGLVLFAIALGRRRRSASRPEGGSLEAAGSVRLPVCSPWEGGR